MRTAAALGVVELVTDGLMDCRQKETAAVHESAGRALPASHRWFAGDWELEAYVDDNVPVVQTASAYGR